MVLTLALGLATAPLRAEDLPAATLVSWCQDAYKVYSGVASAIAVSQLDQTRSNATACIGYLRGWLDSQQHIRSMTPMLGACPPTPDNMKLVNGFLDIAEKQGWEKLPLSEGMSMFSYRFCPIARAEPAAPMQQAILPAPMPGAQISTDMLPQIQPPPAAQISTVIQQPAVLPAPLPGAQIAPQIVTPPAAAVKKPITLRPVNKTKPHYGP